MKKRKGFFSKKMLQKIKENRTWWRWDDIDRGFAPKSKFTQHNFHCTCNLALRKALWGVHQVFFFLEGWEKTMHHDRDIDHFVSLLHFADHFPQFLNTLELVVASHRAMYWICWTTTVLCTSLSSTMCTMTNSTHQTDFGVVSSLFSCCFFSCTFLHPSPWEPISISISNHASSSFKESISIPQHCKGASNSPQWFCKVFF